MKMSKELFNELRAVVRVQPNANMRERWDALWASGFQVNALYDAGLNDDHIDTALREIGRLSK